MISLIVVKLVEILWRSNQVVTSLIIIRMYSCKNTLNEKNLLVIPVHYRIKCWHFVSYQSAAERVGTQNYQEPHVAVTSLQYI